MLIRILFLLIVFLFQISCANKNEKSYQDLFALRILLETATKPKPNPQVACIDTIKTMEVCAAMSPQFSSFPLNETIFAPIISSNRFTTYSDYCINLLAGEFYKNQSDSIKECFFKCDRSYWQTRKNLNICNSSFETMIQGSGSDNGTANCKRNCLIPTNNTP